MHPWLSWLRWINPVQYGFEALMANEFYNLEIECVSPMLVPQGPNAQPQYQSCTIQGSQPGQTTVSGADYILTAYTYTRAHRKSPKIAKSIIYCVIHKNIGGF